MSASNEQIQSFGDIKLLGQGHTLTINQTIQVTPTVVNARPFVAQSPYLGLRHFAYEHSQLFFGRTRLVSELVAVTADRPFTLVGGASGSGKSSLVRAGLLPQLQQHLPKLKIFTLVPDNDPFDSLRAALIQLGSSQEHADVALARQPDTLLQVCQNAELRPAGQQWFLFIDQFEQLFTRTTDLAIRSAFIEGIVRFVETAPTEVRLVAALRADYFDRLHPYPEFLKLVENCIKMVSSPDAQDLRQCIEQPAALRGVLFEEGLVDTIIEEVDYQPGGLPLLQYTLDRLWEEERPTWSRRLLSRQGYDRLGGVREALMKRADAVYRYTRVELQQPRSGQEQQAMRHVFLRLVDLTSVQDRGQPVSRRVALAEFPKDEQALIEALIAERLLVNSRGDAGVALVEVAHEALLYGWPLLNEWLAQEREAIYVYNRLSADALLWQQASLTGEESAKNELLRGSRLAQAGDMARRGDFRRIFGDTESPALVFLRASLDEQERVLAEQQRQVEREERYRRELAAALDVAKRARDEAEQRELDFYVEQGRQLLVEKGRPVSALLWLQRAYARGSRNPVLPYLLADAVRPVAAMRVALQGHARSVLHISLSPDGRRVLTISEDCSARVWDSQTGGLLFALNEHKGPIRCASFSRDGLRLLTTSDDHTARIWDAISGACIIPLIGHSAAIRHSEFGDDGRYVLTTSDDKTARIWDSMSGSCLVTLTEHKAPVRSASFSSDGRRVLTAGFDGTAHVYYAQSGILRASLKGHNGAVLDACFSPDGQRILTASADRTARIWDADSGRLHVLIQGHEGPIVRARFRYDGRRVLTASDDGTARISDAETGAPVVVLKGHSDSICSAQFSRSGHRVLTASADCTARIWDAESGSQIAALQGHSERVLHACFSLDGNRVLTASADRTARIWNAECSKAFAVLEGHSDIVLDACFSHDDNLVLTASSAGPLQIWNTRTARPVATLRGHDDAITDACFSPDSSSVLTASADSDGRIWDVVTGGLRATLIGHSGALWHGCFHPDGLRVLTASEDATARIWEVQTGKCLAILSGHTDWIPRACFSPDGRLVLTVSHDHTARIWDALSGKSLATLAGHADYIRHGTFSPDGQRVVTASYDGTARVWDTTTQKLVAVCQGHSDKLNSACFSRWGRRVLTASDDRTARIWDSDNGKPLAVLEGHIGSVLHATFNFGRRVLTASDDRTARIWDAETGRLLVSLEGHTLAVRKARFSRNGRWVLTASSDRTARIWTAAPEERKPDEINALIEQRVPFRLEGGVIVRAELKPTS